MDKRIEAQIRPKYVELIKMSTEKDMDEVASRYFAGKEAQLKKENPSAKVDRSEFWSNFSIKMEDYVGYYAEVGGTSAIRGASFPTNKVRPIFTIQMSRSGRNWKVVSKACPGFFSNDLARAWIEVDVFENMLGDTFFDDLDKKAKKIEEYNKKKARNEERKERTTVKIRNWTES